MDLGTIKEKLSRGTYRTIEQYHRDVGLVFENCITFNGKEDPFGQVKLITDSLRFYLNLLSVVCDVTAEVVANQQRVFHEKGYFDRARSKCLS